MASASNASASSGAGPRCPPRGRGPPSGDGRRPGGPGGGGKPDPGLTAALAESFNHTRRRPRVEPQPAVLRRYAEAEKAAIAACPPSGGGVVLVVQPRAGVVERPT